MRSLCSSLPVVVSAVVLVPLWTSLLHAQGPVLIKNLASRELTLFVENGPERPFPNAVSRELTVVVASEPPPAAIVDFDVSAFPDGSSVTLDWSGYNQWAELDIGRFDLYHTDSGPFSDVTQPGLTRLSVPAETTSHTIEGLVKFTDHYFAIVPVDVLGEFNPLAAYSAAYALTARLASRQYTIQVERGPARPGARLASREWSILVPDSKVPDQILDLNVDTSRSAYGAVDMDFSPYNELLQRDIVRYNVYVSDTFFSAVNELMRPFASFSPGNRKATLPGLEGDAIRYFAVVAVDALGNFDPAVRSTLGQASAHGIGEVPGLAAIGALESLTFRWAPPRSEAAFRSGYHLYFDGAPNPVVLPPDATIWTVSGLTAGRRYALRVSTVDVFGGESRGRLVVGRTGLIQSGPDSQSLPPGEVLTLTVEAAGMGPFTYQWRRNGEDLVDGDRVSGARAETLTILGVEPTDGGSYSVVVGNAEVSEESEVAVVRIALPDLGFADGFADAGALVGAAGIGRADSSGATADVGEPEHAGKLVGASMWIDWTAPASGAMTLVTLGSSFDTLLAVYQGASLGALTELAADDDSGGFLTSRLRFNAVAGQTYHIVVDGFDGATGEIVLEWELEPERVVPTIATQQQPRSRSVAPGESAVFSVGVDPANLTFQWLRNGVPVPGATQPGLVLEIVQPSDAASYSVVVQNAFGESVISRRASLDVGVADPDTLFEDKLADAVRRFENSEPMIRQGPGDVPRAAATGGAAGIFPAVIGLKNTVHTHNAEDSLEIGERYHGEVPGGGSKWIVMRAPMTATVRLDTVGSEIGTAMALYRRVFDEVSNQIAQELVAEAAENSADRETVLFADLMEGAIYSLVVVGEGEQRGLIQVNSILGKRPVVTERAPERQVLEPGGPVRLWANAEADPAPTYRWWRNGVEVEGETSWELTIPAFDTEAHAGLYRVEATNVLGTVAAEEFLLAPPLGFRSMRLVGRELWLKVEGAVGESYQLEVTTDFREWTPVAALVPEGLTAEHVVVTDGSPRFFRLVEK